MKSVNIAVVGATGLVGRTFLKLLETENFEYNELRLFASEKSLNTKISVKNKDYLVKTVTNNCFLGCDFVFLFTNNELSKKYAKIAIKNNATVIDNSSAFRLKKNVPLIVPEINFNQIAKSKLIANPNCSTIIASLPLFAILKRYKISEICFTTFQAVSGSGIAGINALNDCINGIKNDFYGCNISKNCLAKIGNINKNGFSQEEIKMIEESKKIFNDNTIKINATCVRVPVENCHAISVFVKLNKNFTLNSIKKCFLNQEGIQFCDNQQIPTNSNATGNNEILVGRLRKAINFDNALTFYVVGDNLVRGASYNAFKIMQKMILKNDRL